MAARPTSNLLFANYADGGGSTQKMKTYYPTEWRWEGGSATDKVATGTLPSTTGVSTKTIIPSAMGDPNNTYYEKLDEISMTAEELKRTRLPDSVKKDDTIKLSGNTSWSNKNKRNEMLNENRTLIQNNYSFPYYIQSSYGNKPAKYDYQIIPGDTRYPAMIKLEDKLKEARASFGINVHGNNDIARAVKYNLYNRYKSPDTNLVFNRLTTHVFFTRPDLNLLNCCDGQIYGANRQIKNHSDTSLLYKTNPYIFRLLTDSKRCGDRNNFNWLLTNQVVSFNIVDEEINTVEVGKSWGGHSMIYGEGYNGKAAGEISCQFNELQDLSVIKMLKLWITYIDNVSTGAWSPSYDLNGSAVKSKYGSFSQVHANNEYLFGKSIADSYVYTKTLDYGASIYVFKCGPDGEDVLYWTKYFGVFPVNTGASALSWDGNPIGSESSKLDIRFKYCYKRDMSPISLVELNEAAGVGDNSNMSTAELSFNPEYNHTSRPYVGAPFIEIITPYESNAKLGNNSDMFGKPRTHVKLRFLKNTDSRLNDDLLFRSQHSGNTIKNDDTSYRNEVQLC